MSIEYAAPDKTTLKLLDQELKQKHQKRLKDAGVTVQILMATDTEGHAVYLHGYAAAAVVGITPYKQRAQGLSDALIVIDQETWEDLETDARKALLDHELTHLEPIYGEDKNPKTDPSGRPKLKMRPHDWEIGGFAEVCQRYGETALDMRQIRGMQHRHGQLVFGFAMDDAKTLAAAAALVGAQLGTPKPHKEKPKKQDDAQATSQPAAGDATAETDDGSDGGIKLPPPEDAETRNAFADTH